MKNKLTFFYLLSFIFLGAITLKGETKGNPKADPGAVVTSGNARFTVLTPEMIRIEYSDKGVFEDRATFTVVNRQLAVPQYKTSEDETFLYLETAKLKMKYRKGSNPKTLPASSSNLSITIDHNGREVLWYPGKPDPMNLKGTCRTLDGSNGQNKRSEMEDGLIHGLQQEQTAAVRLHWRQMKISDTTGGQTAMIRTRWISTSSAMETITKKRCQTILRLPVKYHCLRHTYSATGIANTLHIRLTITVIS